MQWISLQIPCIVFRWGRAYDPTPCQNKLSRLGSLLGIESLRYRAIDVKQRSITKGSRRGLPEPLNLRGLDIYG